MKLPDQDKYTGLRDYYLILIMLGSGIRPSEAFRLLPVDFMEKAAEIYIPAKIAKARKSRTLHLSDMTVRAIHKLLLARTDDWSPDTPIFCSYEGRQMNRHTVGRPDGIVQRSARRAHTAV
ncbi:site-specific integrase [Paenibacillus sp. FSL E2-0230]|uniref:site-specific integrase n=1 Tax=unclassified Paenibacillus TaxID=185978 RepID=UPI0030D4C9E3